MKINRYYILLALWVTLLGWCVTNENVYINAFVLFFGFLFVVCGFGYVEEHMNEKEETFFNNLVSKF